MADSDKPCNEEPCRDIYSCTYSNGISIIQPKCQVLPGGSIIDNPSYVPSFSSSFWTYKFMIDCSRTGVGIRSIGIPICCLIKAENIKVYEKIDCSCIYKSITFTLIKDDPCFYIAPQGFQWLKIENHRRYSRGVCVKYLIEILGNYSPCTQSIKVKTTYDTIKFTETGILVPNCNEKGTLSVKKNCVVSIINNQAVLKYKVSVLNVGNTTLNNVNYNDKVHIPISFTLGEIVVNPPTFSIDRSMSEKILIYGCINTIKPGQMVVVTYSIPVVNVAQPRKYIINSSVRVSALNTSDCAVCSINIEAVKLQVQKHCSIIEKNKGAFTFTILNVRYSPDTVVNVIDSLFVPSGLILQFNDFGGCNAVFENKDTPVPLDTNIIGPQNIVITCNNLRILEDGCVHKTIGFTVISSGASGKATVTNTLKSIVLSNPDSQIFIHDESLPISSYIDVFLNVKCSIGI